MHNLFISKLRRARSRSTVEASDLVTEAGLGQRPSQEDQIAWLELARAFERLSSEQKAVLMLVSIEDLSYAEVARVLEIPIGTVMSRLSRARERLRFLTEGASADTRRREQ